MTRERQKQLIDAFLVPMLAVLSGLLLAGVMVLFTDTPPLQAYRILFQAGFGCQELSIQLAFGRIAECCRLDGEDLRQVAGDAHAAGVSR